HALPSYNTILWYRQVEHALPSYNTILWYQQVEHALPSYNTMLWYQQVEHALPSYNTMLWYQQVEHALPSYNTMLWYQQVEHALPSYNTMLWYRQVEHALPSYNTMLWYQQVEHALPSYNTILWYQQVEHALPSYNTMLWYGLVEGSEVTQTPTILWGLKDSDAQINCSHTKGVNYYQMYWYRQRPGEGIKQVALTTPNSKSEYSEDFSEDKYPTVKTDAESGSFTVKKVEAGDSGMYFCAVYEHRESFSSMVNQSPGCTNRRTGKNVQLTCSHNIPNYQIILWYQQSAGDTAMKLIGYVYVQSVTLESPLEKHFNVSGDGRKEASLHLLSLRGPEDSAVYYCAASQHSDNHLNMITLLIQVATLLLWVTGLSQTDKVYQTPTEILKRPEDKVQLSCSHNDPNYYMILWYQQSAQNTALKLIGYVRNTSPTVEDSFKERFNVSGDAATGNTVYLHIPKLREAEDSAVYFCAARILIIIVFLRIFIIIIFSFIIMFRVLIHLAALPLWVTGLVEGSEVTQTPTILWGLKDSDAQMNCSHTKGATYFQMYWYRQRPGEGMKQVAFTTPNSKSEYSGDFSEDKYPTVRNAAESGSFTVKKVEAGDSGIIFIIIIFSFIIMFRVLIHLAALPLWVTGESFSSMVNQSPVALIGGPGRNVQLTCSHTIPNYRMILWYQQSAGDTAMKLIGYVNVQSITLESPLEKHFNVSGDGRKEAHLHLLSLRGPEDSAVYYCAASQHSDVEHPLSST
ncbi:unnamed protein product, partial [Coregonus sp. 'balchen']